MPKRRSPKSPSLFDASSDQSDVLTRPPGGGETPVALHTAAGEPNGIAGNRLFTGLTLDSPTDEDWYRFRLDPSQPPSTLRLTSISPQDRITLAIMAVQPGGTPTPVPAGSKTLAVTQGVDSTTPSAGSYSSATGVLSLHGYFEPADVAAACKRFDAALAKGYAAANFRLAQCVEKQDPKRAATLLRDAAGSL